MTIGTWEEVALLIERQRLELALEDKLRALIADKMDGKATHLVVPKQHEHLAHRIAKRLGLELRSTGWLPAETEWFVLNAPPMTSRDLWEEPPKVFRA